MFSKEGAADFNQTDMLYGLDFDNLADLLHALNSLSVPDKRKLLQSLL